MPQSPFTFKTEFTFSLLPLRKVKLIYPRETIDIKGLFFHSPALSCFSLFEGIIEETQHRISIRYTVSGSLIGWFFFWWTKATKVIFKSIVLREVAFVLSLSYSWWCCGVNGFLPTQTFCCPGLQSSSFSQLFFSQSLECSTFLERKFSRDKAFQMSWDPWLWEIRVSQNLIHFVKMITYTISLSKGWLLWPQ